MCLLKMLAPRRFADHITQVDPDLLWDEGYRALVLDLDNTLVPWMTKDLSDEIKSWLRRAQERGFSMCVLSNTRRRGRLDWAEGALGCAAMGVELWGMKPRKAAFRRAMAKIGADPAHTVMIGDQVFTDILGGNLAGLHTIFVEPLNKREFFGTKISRFFERILFRLAGRRQQTTDNRPQTTDSFR